MSNPNSLAIKVSRETGLHFLGSQGSDSDGSSWLELRLAEHPVSQTFTIKTLIGWRRLSLHFSPGIFASDLLEAMRCSDQSARKIFQSLLDFCEASGAEVHLIVNSVFIPHSQPSYWETPWKSFGLSINIGMIPINVGDLKRDAELIDLWNLRFSAAILALLPLDTSSELTENSNSELIEYPEGAKFSIEVNRYERDKRNRAAALAIHGYSCKVCGLTLKDRYGDAAQSLIEVHHTTPVSQLGPGYLIDLQSDLVPLCPNCHSVAHRRNPPFSVTEMQEMIMSNT